MKKSTKIAGMAAIALLLAGCQNTENDAGDQDVETVDENSQNDTAANQSDTTDADENSEEVQEDTGDETVESDSDTYEEIQMTPNYFIDTHIYSAETEFLTAFIIKRDEERDLSTEERLALSLIENDPSEQGILGSFTDLTVDWPNLHVNFNEEGNQLSATSAQSILFYDSLFGISDLFGIEEISFLNPEGEERITVAERLVDAPLLIEDERSQSHGYYTIYDRDSERTFFLPAGELEEQVMNGNGEPLSFPEAIEAMGTVDGEDAFYSSAIVEGLEVVDASLENGVAAVQYTMDDEVATEADRIVFENAMQLTALDFHASEVRITNDSLQESVTYPLVGQ